MTRASRRQVQDAIAYAQANPSASAADIADVTGVSATTAKRALDGSLADRSSSPSGSAAEGPATPSGPASPSFPGPAPRRTKPARRRLTEPSDQAVEGLYTLSCTIAGVALAVAPPQYQLTDIDKEMILRPLARMYLRRQKVPVISPDAQDLMTICIGVFGYGLHAFTGRYGGRDAGPAVSRPRQPTAGPGNGRAEVPSAAAAGHAGHARGNGQSGHAGPGNPFDPQAVMDRLEQELRAAAAASAESEAVVASGGSDA